MKSIDISIKSPLSFIETYKTQNITKGKNTMEYIVLHHTGGGTWVSNAQRLSNPKSGVSVHFVVWEDWKIYKLANGNQITWHAGVSSWEWKTNLNQYSVWIEIVWPWFTDIQRQSVRELIKYLLINLWLDYTKIIRHKDIAPKRKIDVDDTFWNNEYQTFNEYKLSFAQKDNLVMTKLI